MIQRIEDFLIKIFVQPKLRTVSQAVGTGKASICLTSEMGDECN